MDKLDLLVVIDPYPSATAAMAAMPAAGTSTRTARLPAAGGDAVRDARAR